MSERNVVPYLNDDLAVIVLVIFSGEACLLFIKYLDYRTPDTRCRI